MTNIAPLTHEGVVARYDRLHGFYEQLKAMNGLGTKELADLGLANNSLNTAHRMLQFQEGAYLKVANGILNQAANKIAPLAKAKGLLTGLALLIGACVAWRTSIAASLNQGTSSNS